MTRREWVKGVMGGLALTGSASVLGVSALAKSPVRQIAKSQKYRYLHLDVFTDRPLTGNQLAVFLDPAGLTTETMQAIAREMAFSEVTFVFPPEDLKTDVRVRIFTPTTEMAFAGHPTIGTAFGLAHAGRIKPSQATATFGLGVGPTPIDLEWKDGRLAFAWMTAPLPTFGKTMDDTAALAAAIGVDAADTSSRTPPQEVSAGGTFLIVPLATRAAVDRAVLDQRAIPAVFEKHGMQRRGLYIFTMEKGSDGAMTYSRLLSASAREDPATGSAAGPLGCYVVHHKLVDAPQAARMINAQGVKVQRPSRIHLNIDVKDGVITRVRIGGESVVLADSALTLG